MAWGIDQQDDGKWRWWVALSAYGAAVGEAETEDEAKRKLAKAQAELLMDEWVTRPEAEPG